MSRNDGNTYCFDSTCGQGVELDRRIRRLTPIECERLQGFPDRWTKYGTGEFSLQRKDLSKRDKNKKWVLDTKKKKKGRLISNSQRYKCLGNAVTVNVIQAIMERVNETLLQM